MCQGPSVATQSDESPQEATATTKPNVKRSGRKDPTLIAGKEVIGRQIAVWSNKTMEWAKATIAQFNGEKGQHLIRFSDREPGSVKHEESWVTLSKTRFQWLGAPPANVAPNPTHVGAPKGEETVGYRVRVFWPGMARWYQGTVQSYDSENGTHTVKYRDGDIQTLKLRNEAVVYLDKLKSIPKDRAKSSKNERMKSSNSKRPRGSENKSSKSEGIDPEGPTTATPSKKRKVSTVGTISTSTSEADGHTSKEGAEASGMVSTASVHSLSSASAENEDRESIERRNGEVNSPGLEGSQAIHIDAACNDETEKTSAADHHPQRRNVNGLPTPRPRGRPPGSGTKGTNRKASMPRKANKLPNSNDEIIRAAGAAVIGARVAIFWTDEVACYKGKLIQFDSYHKRHKIMYDDGEEEWIALPRESFRYLAPRAQSAGCTDNFRRAMAQLGADQESGHKKKRRNVDKILSGSKDPIGDIASEPPAEKAVGWRVSLRSASDGRWYGAEVLCFDSSHQKHLVLYDDGEDEWVCFSEEEVRWHDPATMENFDSSLVPKFPGKASEHPPPSGQSAVGWRIAVFWPGDMTFYSGEISSFDEETGRHDVSYDDTEEGTIKIGEDKVKWILAPGVAVDPEAIERLELGGSRPRRRITTNGGDSDPDFEFEQHLQQQHTVGGTVGAVRGSAGGRRGRGGGRGSSAGRTSHLNCSAWAGENSGGRDTYSGIPMALQARPGLLQYQFSAGGPQQNMNSIDMDACGDPILVRRITKVPSFASTVMHGNTKLSSSVAVRIYLSKSPELTEILKSKKAADGRSSEAQAALPTAPDSQEANTAEKVGAADVKTIEKPSEIDKTDRRGKTDESVEAERPSSKPGEIRDRENRQIGSALDSIPFSTPFAADRDNIGRSMEGCAHVSIEKTIVSRSDRFRSRLKALDLMSRRVGRAQQAIIKGIPTDLPNHVVRPLRTGPPPGMRAMAARTAMNSSTHRLAHASSSLTHVRLHRRRALEEEEEDVDDGEPSNEVGQDDMRSGARAERGVDNNCLDLDRRSNGFDDRKLDATTIDADAGMTGKVAMESSSGSSDIFIGDGNANEADDLDDSVVMSPRTAFARGSKVKPSSMSVAVGGYGLAELKTSRHSVQRDDYHEQDEAWAAPSLDRTPSPGNENIQSSDKNKDEHLNAVDIPRFFLHHQDRLDGIPTTSGGSRRAGESHSEDANNAAAGSSSHDDDLAMEGMQHAANVTAALGGSDSVANLLSMNVEGNHLAAIGLAGGGFETIDLVP